MQNTLPFNIVTNFLFLFLFFVLTYHSTVTDLPHCLLYLLELLCEVPEARLGRHLVRSEYSHGVEVRALVLLRGHPTPDHLVLLQLVRWGGVLLQSTHTTQWLTYVPLRPHSCLFTTQTWKEKESMCSGGVVRMCRAKINLGG